VLRPTVRRQARTAFAYLEEVNALGAELSMSMRLLEPPRRCCASRAAHDPSPHRQTNPTGRYSRLAATARCARAMFLREPHRRRVDDSAFAADVHDLMRAGVV
jgi:hypothetical protein